MNKPDYTKPRYDPAAWTKFYLIGWIDDSMIFFYFLLCGKVNTVERVLSYLGPEDFAEFKTWVLSLRRFRSQDEFWLGTNDTEVRLEDARKFIEWFQAHPEAGPTGEGLEEVRRLLAAEEAAKEAEKAAKKAGAQV